MKPYFAGENKSQRGCEQVQTLLSGYVDNTLSARQAWSVEKHLANCPECHTLSQELRATVSLLQATPHLDTADDFMAKLHARLDTIEPESLRKPSPLEATRDWLAGALDTVRTRRAPVLSLGGLGVAMAALVTLWLLPNRTPVAPVPQNIVAIAPNPPPIPEETLQRNVALAASNPLDDPAAANLQAHFPANQSSAENDAPIF